MKKSPLSPRMCIVSCIFLFLAFAGPECPLLSSSLLLYTSADPDSFGCNSQYGYGCMYAPMDMAAGEGEGEGEQTRDIIEPDVIRLDGDTLYVLNQVRGLVLLDLREQPGPAILSSVPTFGVPRDLYLQEDKAYVLVDENPRVTTEDETLYVDSVVKLYIVDVATPTDPEIVGEFDIEGSFVDSRLVGDVLYAVATVAPEIYYDDVGWADAGFKAGSVGLTQTDAQGSYSIIKSVNIADPEDIQEVDEVTFPGHSYVINVTETVIFVAANETYNSAEITYVDISDAAGDITVRDSVEITGTIQDKFKLDPHQGVLRVVSYAGSNTHLVLWLISSVTYYHP
ncbi:beta-propeller domain-containing protein [Candidatus Hydrogenedentota bacterium]